jgi:hypothetical protein
MVEVVKHLESVQWKKSCRRFERARKKRGEILSSITAEPKRKKYMITENQYLR